MSREFNQLQINLSGQNLQLAELEILDLNGTNIALLGTATVTAPHSNSAYVAGKANDGDTNQIISRDSIAIALQNNGVATWILDLDRGYTLSELNKVIFYNRDDTTVSSWAIGGILSFYSTDEGDPEQVGVLTSDLIQEFVITALPDFLPTAGVTSISATVVEFTGALTYQITIQESPSGTTRVSHTGISTGDFIINALTPETTYIVQLYADTGSGYNLVETETVTTLANSAVNYDTSVFGSNGEFDLSVLDNSSFALLDEVINDLFTTGDKLDINLRTTTSDVAFVKVGEAVSTDSSILVPFSSAGGSGQVITMNLSDTSTVSVTYDDVNNALDIGGSTVQVEESIVVDGKKLTVKEV